MKQIGIQEVHQRLLNLAKSFDEICTRHGIPYYMLGGTMLGAIRHKGFIPWDDDMDFGVPRIFFERLKVILGEELSGNYGILTMKNSDALLIDIVKIHDRHTVIKEKYKENVNEEFGVNIDIFPLDETLCRKSIRSKIIQCLLSLQLYRFLSIKSRPLHKKIIAILIKVVFFYLRRNTITKFINSVMVEKKGQYIANYYGAWGNKETVASEVMGNPVRYDFENFQFYGVTKPHDYLSSLYGDYMKMPPENKRHIHITDVFVK